MVRSKEGRIARELETLWTAGTLTGLSDSQLLQRFAFERDATAELAFRELLERHAPMVIGVCRQILRRPHDVDDAFQATFLVLVRKARSIHVRESLAPWLYRVAYRTAQRARACASRRAATGLEEVESLESAGDDGCAAFETAPLLHDEISRLPEKYRSPIVLCHLEGKSHEEAARVLNWPVGTLSGRLSRGRALLKGRLERRGLAVPAAAISRPFLNVSELPSQALIASTLKSASLFASSQPLAPNVLSLTQGVLRTMLLHKIKTVSLAAIVIGSLSGVAGAIALRAAQEPARPAAEEPPKGAGGQTQVKPTTQAPDDLPLGQRLVPAISANPFEGKNYPNLAGPRDPIPAFGMGSILLVKSQDGRSYEAWSDDVDPIVAEERWQRLAIPEDLKLTPVCGADALAFAYEGKKIDEVAAFSGTHGKWARVKLTMPVEGSLVPHLGPGFVLYQAGNVFYAFSASKGEWATLEVPADRADKPRASSNEKHILVQQGKRLYAFSLKQGKWSMPVEMDVPAKSK